MVNNTTVQTRHNVLILGIETQNLLDNLMFNKVTYQSFWYFFRCIDEILLDLKYQEHFELIYWPALSIWSSHGKLEKTA